MATTMVTVRGKGYSLFKRASTFYFRFQSEGVRRTYSTRTSDLSVAKIRAKQKIIEVLDSGWGIIPQKSKVPTVEQCVDVFLNGDQHVKATTARDYVARLYLVMEEVFSCTREDARAMRISCLNESTVRTFQAKRQGGKKVSFVEPLQVNAVINSNIRQARSVFSRRALSAYANKGMIMPDTITGFLKAPLLREVSHRYSDNPIPQKQIDAMNKALPALKEQDPRLWAVHLMIRLMGMRDSEILAACKSWIIEREGRSYLVINRREGIAPKRSDGEIPVPAVLLEWFDAQDGDHLIPAKHKTARYDVIYREHNKFVRKHIPGRQKGNHELRKWAGSLVATKTNSYERAADFLRIDIATAKAHYLAFVSPADALSLDDL